MRLLTLIRHAKSSWDYPGLTDFERPLNDRGRRDAPRMAQRLGRSCKPPLLLLSSPATRAVTTARLFAETLAVDLPHCRSSRASTKPAARPCWN